MAEKKSDVLVDIHEVSTNTTDSQNKSEFNEKEHDRPKVQAFSVENLREKAIARLESGLHKDLDDLRDMGPAMEYLFDQMMTISEEEAVVILENAIDYHNDDENFPEETLRKIKKLALGEEEYGTDHEDYVLDLMLEATLIHFHSPYPEVRAICDPMDDPTLPVETIRAYFLGIVWVGIGAFINELFSWRQPSLKLKSTAIQLLIFPCGKFLAKVLPDWGFVLFGTRYTLNPGPWSMKEQMLATLMTNVGATSSNFMSYVLVMRLERFFGQKWATFGFVFLLNFSTQFFGFGLGGLLRRWVVYPAKAVWPSLLPTLMLNRTLLIKENGRPINGWRVSRYKFFWIVLIGIFLYYWLPGYAFTALSNFNWMTWISPTNTKLAIITGSGLGLGFNPWTSFDWGVIGYSTPLNIPFFSQLNRYIGMLFAAVMIVVLYWKNYKWSAYIPINTNTLYNNVGTKYNASRIVNDDLTLNLDNYKNYSPPFISLGYLTYYGSEFTMFTLSFVYVFITEWRRIKDALVGFYTSIVNRKASNYDLYDDALSRHMAKYPEVPDWWYMILLVLSLVFGIVACQAYPTNTPFWSVIVIIVICIVLLIPSAIIYSVTGYELGFNDIGIIVGGYMIPEHAIANMICRVYGWNVDAQAESFIGDQKLAHYAKIPPRAMFRAQLLAVFIQVFITIAATETAISSIPDLCSTTQADKFYCTFPNALFTATLVWGVIGPRRTFTTLYPMLQWAFLIGALAAVPCWYIRKRWMKYFKYFNPTLFLSGMTRFESSYNLSYYTPGVEAGFLFMYYIRRRYLAWWTKYTYVLTSALSAGVAFSAILIFVSVQVTKTTLTWWGNTVSSSGVDGAKVGHLLTLGEGEYFGPTSWE
ncbi:OPT oligopeptide transporter protein-domain-containing protein [Limtongia smithiae]|uniref:OPT oligopeptide transporter protein-domain-containing protein n=1 Tax=Limtongia smithiae TaxID=1125753 RepID=UPI0034CFB6C1